MSYVADPDRYQAMTYRFCGRSGLLLPALSLGLWHNFGDATPLATYRRTLASIVPAAKRSPRRT